MRILADTANLEELKKLKEMGIVDGVTTNPSIISKEGSDCLAVLKAIVDLFPGLPVFGQVTAETKDGMIEQAKKINSVGDNMVVKIPATIEGIKAIAVLSELGIATCATAVLTAGEALLLAQAGATYVAPYTGQNDIIGFRGVDTLDQMGEMFARLGYETQILAASIEKSQEMVDYFISGADCITVPYFVFEKTFTSPGPLTSHYVNNFKTDWENASCFIK